MNGGLVETQLQPLRHFYLLAFFLIPRDSSEIQGLQDLRIKIENLRDRGFDP